MGKKKKRLTVPMSGSSSIPVTTTTTTSAFSDSLPSVENVTKWKRKEVLAFLQNNEEVLDIDPSDTKVIEDNRVAGLAFLGLTERKLVKPPYNLPGGPAGAVANLVKRINEGQEQPGAEPPKKRVKIDENLNKFWQALKRASHKDYLMLSDSTKFLGKGVSVLKIRKCYLDLLSVVFNNAIRKLRITGNPGIGKTYFGYYLLYKLALQDATVVYDDYNETDPIVFEGRKGAFTSDEIGIKPYLRNKAVWYIVDGKQPKDVMAKTILICSPKKTNYTQFDKFEGTTIRYMPRWNWIEIKDCREKLYCDKVSLKLAKKLFSNWGGIPRYVLEKANDSTQQSKLNDAIKSCKENIFDHIGERSIERTKFSHIIIHIDVNLPVKNELNQLQLDRNGQPPYTEVILRFASDYVRDKVTDKLETSIRQRLLEKTKAGTGNSLLGSAFEYMAHKILRNGGKFDVRPLERYKFDKYNNVKIDPKAKVKLPEQESTLYFNKTNINVIKDN